VHAAGIELDHTFFVGQAAEADAIVFGIVFRTFDYAQRGVERIAAALERSECVFEIGVAVVGADDDGSRARVFVLRLRVFVLVLGWGWGSYSGGDGS
jgi:hypothetical protein